VSASGTGAKRTIPALQSSTLCSVVAIHGRDAARLARIAGEYHVARTFTDLKAMISDGNFDFAIVCSPPFLHAAQVGLLAHSGVPVLLEKPLASSMADAEEIARVVAETGIPFRVAHQLRHQPIFHEIKRTLKAGDLGEVCRASFEWSFRLNKSAPSASWKLDPNRSGLTPLSDAGIHCLDIAVALLGPGRVIFAHGNWSPESSIFEDVEIVSQHGSVMLHVVASWLYGPYSNPLVIAGKTGSIEAREFFTERSAPSVMVMLQEQKQIIAGRQSNPYRDEVEDFARLLADPEWIDPGTSIGEAIQSLQIVADAERILRSTYL
jgi:predicted dehydrogenase